MNNLGLLSTHIYFKYSALSVLLKEQFTISKYDLYMEAL